MSEGGSFNIKIKHLSANTYTIYALTGPNMTSYLNDYKQFTMYTTYEVRPVGSSEYNSNETSNCIFTIRDENGKDVTSLFNIGRVKSNPFGDQYSARVQAQLKSEYTLNDLANECSYEKLILNIYHPDATNTIDIVFTFRS